MMNERIKELAKQSGLIQYDTDGKMVDINKFAELLVRECAEVGLDSCEDGDDIEAIMKRVHNNILKHFGVDG